MRYNTSIKDAASQLGITVQGVHKRIKSGTLQAQKVNQHWMVASDSIQAAKKQIPKPGRPRKGQDFVLMNATYPVMEFSFDAQSGAFLPRDVFDAARAPIGTVTRTGRGSADGLQRWWSHRSIPESREGIDAKLAELGLNDPSLIPFRNLGLSLSDQYWIQPTGKNLDWQNLNYFQNSFGNKATQWDQWLSSVGLSSPDNTSEGVLPKKWVCEGKERILLKGHIPWTDQQVYNEAVATALHERILLPGDFVTYEVRQIGGLGVVSACRCFIKPNEEYVPYSLISETEGRFQSESVHDTLVRHATNLGIAERIVRMQIAKMIVSDNLLANTDRHLRNFGFVRNVDTLEWRFAPLFDSGNSLWYDKDNAAAEQKDYSFVSRPFDPAPNRQLMLAAQDSWVELDLLDGFADQAATILEKSSIGQQRVEFIREGILQRIHALQVVWS